MVRCRTKRRRQTAIVCATCGSIDPRLSFEIAHEVVECVYFGAVTALQNAGFKRLQEAMYFRSLLLSARRQLYHKRAPILLAELASDEAPGHQPIEHARQRRALVRER